MTSSTSATKLYLAGLVLLVLALIVFVQAAFNLGPLVSPSQPGEVFLFYSLSTFIFLVLIIFGFVLARNLIKLWVEHKIGQPGAKFRTRLVLSLIGVTLVPAVFLFLFAFGLVNRSIDKWFSAPMDTVFQTTEEMSEEWVRAEEATAVGVISFLANEPPEDLDGSAASLGMEAVAFLDAQGRLVRASAGAVSHTELFERHLPGVQTTGRAVVVATEGRLIAFHLLEGDGSAAWVAGLFPTSEPFAQMTAEIAGARQSYSKQVQDRTVYRDTYVLVLVLITILVLFAAVWTGLFLSKRITVPIQALAGATREISAGNLDHRVRVEAEDELGMLVGLFNDMADQLQVTTRELDRRGRYTEIILESIPTGVISIDDDFRVTTMNRAARTMFSIETANTLEDVFTAEDREQIGELLRIARQEGIATREITLRAGDRGMDSAVTASLLSGGGYVLVVEDLTEVVKAQKATAWREVARRLAHEIKNPLTPIQLSAERISRNIQRAPNTDVRTRTLIQECVDAITGEVGSLKALVDEFGRVARLPVATKRPSALGPLVDKTLALYEDRFNGTSVRAVIPDGMPAVMMDGQQIKRVLINLIDNALEAMSGQERKELTIGCELVRDRTMARLSIADNGHGIQPEDRERVFAPYFSTRKDGTGLGLAIASRIVADHGGYIGTEPMNPHGARFVVELPVCQES